MPTSYVIKGKYIGMANNSGISIVSWVQVNKKGVVQADAYKDNGCLQFIALLTAVSEYNSVPFHVLDILCTSIGIPCVWQCSKNSA